jgi:drug/metabolite transporter (DMT)-like permease
LTRRLRVGWQDGGVAVALALLTSVAYGLSNYVGPRLARDAPLYLLLVVGQSCSLVLAAVVVAGQGVPLPTGGDVGFALLAGLGNAGGLVLLYRAAEVGPLSVIMPIGALGAAVPVVVGVAGGEGLTVMKAAGMALALTGVVLVARRPPGGRPAADVAAAAPHPDAPPADGGHRRAVVLAALSALCFGTFLAAMGPAAEDSAGWAVLISRASLLVVLLFFAVRLGALRGVTARRLPLLTVPGLLLFAGTLAYAAATRQGDLSVVSVLSSLFPVVTVALALGLDRERLGGTQALGVAGTIAGVVLLSAR